MLLNFIAKLWNGLASPLRRRVAWLAHPKFTRAVAGVVLDKEGRILLLKHRFWKGQCWGLPGGHAMRGETPAETLRRELREEVGMDVRPLRLLSVGTRQKLMTEFVVLAESSGEPEVKSFEIIEARFCPWAELPGNLLKTHRALLDGMPAPRDLPGLPLEE